MNNKEDREKTPQVGIAVIIQNDNGEILLGRRKGAHGTGYFALPGGKPGYGENLYDAAVREVREETRLAVTMVELVSVTDDQMPEYDKHFVTLGFLARLIDPKQEPQTREPDKCEGWGWYSLASLPQPMFPYTIKLLQNFQEHTVYPLCQDTR